MERRFTFDQLPQEVHRLSRKLDSIEKLLFELANQSPPEPVEKLLTIQEAANILRVTVSTMYGKVHRQEVPYMKRGNRLYFSNLELLDYLKAGRKKSMQEISEIAGDYIKSTR